MSQDRAATPPARSVAVPFAGLFLWVVVFLAGVATLGIEMVASRLLAPFFGTSQPIWAVIIGLTLIYLSIGYRLGGRLADRRPDERLLYWVILASAFFTAIIPLIAQPILRFSQDTIATIAVGSFLGALFGVLLLFAAPIILLAMVGPFAIRIALRSAGDDVSAAGTTAGTISAVSTVGSIVGTFLTVLYFIPTIGTARTTYLFAALLAIVATIGLGSRRALGGLALVVLIAIAGIASAGGVKAAGCAGCTLIEERESAYNYIQVAQREHPIYGPQMALILNEGFAVHSYYNLRYAQTGDARDLLSAGGPWDYFAVAPYFVADREPAQVTRMAMLGSAAGTIPAQFLAIYGGDTTIDAVEIDPAIIDAGRQYFAMRDAAVAPDHPNYRVYAEDARAWLATSGGVYDVIGMDAYHQPYIPFHLTTVEFFSEVRARLADGGVAVVNAGLGPDGDDRLSQAIATTMRQVFPHVYVIDTARFGNQILVGVTQRDDGGLGNFIANYERIDDPTLQAIMETVVAREFDVSVSEYTPFTDDRAPVEALIDSLIFKIVSER
jgi:MFS family permease